MIPPSPGSSWPTEQELDELIRRFRDRTLPKGEWTHRAHLAVGAWHVVKHGPARALDSLRSGITRLNDAHGTVNDDRGGYHETITRAYVELLAGFVADRQGLSAAACARELLASPLAEPKALLRYYSQTRLMSVAARRGWLEPDVAALRLTSSGPRQAPATARTSRSRRDP